VEIGDGEAPRAENLDGAERVESVARADDQDVLERPPPPEPLERPECDRKPRLIDRGLERIGVLGQAKVDRPSPVVT